MRRAARQRLCSLEFDAARLIGDEIEPAEVREDILVAVLGSVLSSAYQAHLNLAELPSAVAQVVKESLFGGLAVAHQLGSAQLLASVRAAFVQGMDISLVAAAGIAVTGLVLALIFLPGRTATKASATEQPEASPTPHPAGTASS